ncbi:hypothetical protein LZ31DRAFT_204011 [Colletotrichum somersetense]|nr:hypothetical protein LZ31DRAFT_204011 [Colletotrichum somersetense]
MDSFLLPCILLVAQSVISRTTEPCQSDPGKCTRALVDRKEVWLLSPNPISRAWVTLFCFHSFATEPAEPSPRRNTLAGHTIPTFLFGEASQHQTKTAAYSFILPALAYLPKLQFLGLGYLSPTCLLHTTFLVRTSPRRILTPSSNTSARTVLSPLARRLGEGTYPLPTLSTYTRQFNPPACLSSQCPHYLLLCIRTSYVQYIERSAYLVVGR